MARLFLFAPCMLFGTALVLPAQWVEVGDAGQLLPAAQIPFGIGPLATIAGIVGAAEADMYQIQIVNPAVFSATTVGGAAFDTQLFLFDERGRGVTFNDDSVGVQSTITGVNVPAPGRYYLAISGYNHDATANGLFIWNNAPFAIERAPDGPGRGGTVNGWSGGSAGGAYTITFVGAAFPGAQILLPDNHHLGKSPIQAHDAGSMNWWGGISAVGRRFMVLYEASNFTGVNGVVGPIGITHLRFRGEDTEHNVGGQTYAGVVVTVYKTSLTTATFDGAIFANNLLPAVTLPLGGVGIPLLTVARSLGTAPNNYNIDIDFGMPLLPYNPMFDPLGQTNLLVEVNYAAAMAAPDPQGSTMVQMQDTTGGIAFTRGRGSYAPAAGAGASIDSPFPPVIGVEFGPGFGGFPVLTPATTERYGAACGGSPSAFYQVFAHDERFDLADPGQFDGLVGLTITPNVYPAPTAYVVTGGALPVDLVNGLLAAPTSAGDDVTVMHALPPGAFFDYPGAPLGGSAVFHPATNGYVIVDPASAEITSDYLPSVAKFLGAPRLFGPSLACFAPFWHDFSANKNAPPLVGSDPLAGMHVVNNMAGTEVLVTWYRVGRYNSVAQAMQEAHTMQASFNWMTGVVQFRYGAMNRICGNTYFDPTSGIVGFSRGIIGAFGSVDPQSRDLSVERPFSTFPEGMLGNMGMVTMAAPTPPGPVYMGRAFPGQMLTWDARGVPPGSLIGVQLLDIAATRPGFMAPGIVAPGCMLSTTGTAMLWEITFFPPAVVAGTVPLAIPPGFNGFELFSQYVILDGLFGAPSLITVASNAVKNTIGLQ